ncbi:hypothetical protein [Lentimicrobium sp.]|jgi:hypothetical protein|uniref:hypothetical protein n=1 Tax=Lentimicrobium sp. TaxID=2034841 RepID=UPI002B870851|nr:hypothetical protein [Lentimicrobium sp.]HRW68216.1 hypothetical protein [Lentimicrobium sp.]
MKFRFIVILSGLLLMQKAELIAGGENRPAGSRSAALGTASVALNDIWSAFNNQAGLARLSDASAAVYYENRFLLKELGYKAGAFALPVKAGTIGLSFGHFGYSAYNESKIGLAFAKAFGKHIAFGLQLDYNMARLAESYGNRNFITFEAGVLANITPQLAIGAHIYNPVSAKLSEFNDERAPVIFRLGAAYEITPKFLLTAETEKDINHEANFKAGIEYKLIPMLHLRGGISTNPASNAFGVGIFAGDFVIDISTSYHYVLGFSPQASIAYKF